MTAIQQETVAGRSPLKESSAVREIAAAVLRGQRLDMDAALVLQEQASLHTLGGLAHAVRLRMHPEPVVTYVVDRNINYTNICACGCKFCAFYAAPDQPGGYVLSPAELASKVEETLALGGKQILLQGGHNPDLRIDFYERMLAGLKQYPIHIHAFSPPEIVYISRLEGLSVAEVIARLRKAGLDSIPGGGAEVLVDDVRQRVAPNKCNTAEWLGVMEEAHRQGMRTTATMMFGHVETPVQRLEHFFAVRDVQDRTNGFTAFIPWTFQPENTAIECRPATSAEYLRTLALARLVLDNVPNIQASWVTMGPDVAQLSLYYGANDFGSTMIEENVVAAAGVRFRLAEANIQSLIRTAGLQPRRRNMDYSQLEVV